MLYVSYRHEDLSLIISDEAFYEEDMKEARMFWNNLYQEYTQLVQA